LYTVEFESDATVITSLSEEDEQEDIEMIIGDDGTVFIRQFQEYKNEYDVVVMNYQQLMDLVSAINSPEGAFKLELIDENRSL